MAERDTTPVTINLDRKRPYRVLDSDKDAVWVGPGACEVPRWVALAWGIIESPATPAAPTPPPFDVSSNVPALETSKPAPISAQASDPSFLAGLGLSDDQLAALQAAGITTRATLAAALEANGDKGFAGMSRTQVRALRKQLDFDALPAEVSKSTALDGGQTSKEG